MPISAPLPSLSLRALLIGPLLCFGPFVAGCGDDGADGGSEGGSEDDGTDAGSTGGEEANRPADPSAEAIGAFLADESYKGEGWTAETAEPRPASDPVSPHTDVRVFLNDEVVASQAAGNDGMSPHDVWSMAVKEMFDGDGALVGQAAMINAPEGDAPVWTYYCWGPADRCGTGSPAYTVEEPLHGQGLDVPCFACHGGNVYTELP